MRGGKPLSMIKLGKTNSESNSYDQQGDLQNQPSIWEIIWLPVKSIDKKSYLHMMWLSAERYRSDALLTVNISWLAQRRLKTPIAKAIQSSAHG